MSNPFKFTHRAYTLFWGTTQLTILLLRDIGTSPWMDCYSLTGCRTQLCPWVKTHSKKWNFSSTVYILIISDLLPLTTFCVCPNEIIHPQDFEQDCGMRCQPDSQSNIQKEASIFNIAYYFGIWRFIVGFKFRNPPGPCIFAGHLPTFDGISSQSHLLAFNNLAQCI